MTPIAVVLHTVLSEKHSAYSFTCTRGGLNELEGSDYADDSPLSPGPQSVPSAFFVAHNCFRGSSQ